MLDFNNLDKPNIGIKYGDLVQDGIPTPENPIYPTGKEILQRCKDCINAQYVDDFAGGTELYCILHGYPCDMIKICNDIIE